MNITLDKDVIPAGDEFLLVIISQWVIEMKTTNIDYRVNDAQFSLLHKFEWCMNMMKVFDVRHIKALWFDHFGCMANRFIYQISFDFY